MYLRTLTRRNKNGTVATYYQLAHNERDPKTKKSIPRIIHNFGRADSLDREILVRLCKSIARVCNLKMVDPQVEIQENETPTHSRTVFQELVYRKQLLEEEVERLKNSEEILVESELKYRQLVEHALLGVSVIKDIRIVYANAASAEMSGYSVDELLSCSPEEVMSLVYPDDRDMITERYQNWLNGVEKHHVYELRIVHKNGEIRWVQNHSSDILFQGEPAIMAAYIDITELKKAEAIAIKHSQNVEDANVALKVLLKRRDEDKTELEEKVIFNIRGLVSPFLDKLKVTRLNERQENYLGIIESNLNDIVEPLARRLSSKYYNFTPTEIQIANLIKQGKASKEISEILNVSKQTIDTHRQNIRKKLGISKKKGNLRSFLMTLQ